MSKERQITAILFTILCCAFTKVQSGNRMALDSVLCLGLPVVEVATIDSIEPTGEYVDAPEGFFGRTVLNAMNVPGRLRVWRPDGILLGFGGQTALNCGNSPKARSTGSMLKATTSL